MNFNKLSNTAKLRTDRNFWVIAIRCGLTFGILFIWDCWMMSRDLNTIVKRYTTKKASWGFFGARTRGLLRDEIERRGLDCKLTWNYVVALNAVCEDYNRKGC